jgi:dihydrolipoamide dehydrogenase
VCLHEGCIPSKTLLFVAETLQLARDAEHLGITFGPPRIDIDALNDWVGSSVGKLARGLKQLCRHHGVEHVQGTGHLEDDRHLAIRGGRVPRLKFRRAIVATGSTAVELPAMPFDSKLVLRPTEALAPREVPGQLLVYGGGYMALELAVIYAALGSSVTLATGEPRLLPLADPDLDRPLGRRLREALHRVAVGTEIASADVEGERVQVQLTGEGTNERAAFDRVIVAQGQRGTTDDLGLEHAMIRTDESGFIPVNEQLRTSNRRVLAVGDATGPPLLADRAIHQGRVAAEVVAGWGSAMDARVVPMVVFTDPQIAWCGLTELEAKSRGIASEVRKVPWGASGRAVGMGRPEGLTKILYDPETKLVLGVGITGPGAAEMIAEGCLAVEMGAELADLAATLHPHPTMSELVSGAAWEADKCVGEDLKRPSS